MAKNMGNVDRIVRLVVAAVLLYAAFGGAAFAAAGLWHWLAIAVAAIFIVTSIVGTCPLYSALGIRTCKAS